MFPVTCQCVKLTTTVTKSGSVSKLVTETEWDHFRSRSLGVLTVRVNPLGVKTLRILSPIDCVTWWCEDCLCKVQVTCSIVRVSVSKLYSKPWTRVMGLGLAETSSVLFECRSVYAPIPRCNKGCCCGVSCILSASLIRL